MIFAADSKIQDSKPKIAVRRMVPIFTLPSTSGGVSGPGALRSKYNMVLAFLDAGADAEAYLRLLAEAYPRILEEQARVIAVVRADLREAQNLHSRLMLPYTLLSDSDGALTTRMLGGPDTSALVVADRFGEVYCLETAPSAAELPSTPTALEWLQYIQVQCPE